MSNFDRYKKERIDKILTNEYLKDFISKNKYDMSFVDEHFNVFNDCLSSLEICANCKGLDTCGQRKTGEYLGLIIEGFINNEVHYCDKYLNKEKQEEKLESFVYSDIPIALYDLNLDNIKCDANLKNLFTLAYKIYLGTCNKGLYIYGDIGVGKTYLSIALANSLLSKGKKVAFIKTNDFATLMARQIMDDVGKYDYLVNRIKKADYVIFDDIGSEPVSEFVRDRLLFNILDYRMENKLVTIFTSNLDLSLLLSHYSFDGKESMKAKRLLERIEILTDTICLEGDDRRRNSND